MLPARAADHSPSSGAAVMKEYSYTSTHPLGHTGPVTASLHHICYYVFIIRSLLYACDPTNSVWCGINLRQHCITGTDTVTLQCSTVIRTQ